MAIQLKSLSRPSGRSTVRGTVARAAAAALVAGMVVVVTPLSAQAAEPASAVRSSFLGGATNVGRSDDGSAPCASNAAGTPTGCTPTAIGQGFPINFYGTTYNNLFINNNGNLTFGAPNAQFSPFPLATGAIPIIAPFFADVDTRLAASGQAVYSNKTISGHNAFGVTWPLVGCYNLNTSVLNDFQVVLIDRTDTGSGNFDLEFNYNQVQWDAGVASGGNSACVGSTNAARIGFAKGNGSTSTTLELPGSATNNVLDGGTQSMTGHSLNSTTPGRYFFTFRNGIPTNVTSLTATLSSGATNGASITTTAMSPVTEAATLAGQTSTAGGTATYTVYSDSLCSTVVGTPQTRTVTNGNIPAAGPVSLPVGTYNMVASYSGDANNNPSATPCGANILTVTPIPLTIVANNQTKAYGTADPAFTFTASGLLPGDSLTTPATCTVSGAHTAPGTYPITCSGGTADPTKYVISGYTAGTLTVTKATVTITADNKSKVYGTADPTFTYSVSGLVGGDTLTTQPTCSVTGAHANAGTYPISCSGANAGGNYTIAYQPGTLTVTKAAVTITADNQTKTYGAADGTFSFTTTGLLAGDSLTTPPTCGVSGAHSDVGSYPITCSGANAGGNYTISYQPGALTVTRATVTITADNQTKTYGAADPTFTYSVAGLVAGDSLTTQPTCTVAGGYANVGSYTITCSGAAVSGNYDIAYAPGTLTVTKKAITITADNQTKTYGDADPTFTHSVTGLVGGDALTTQPTCDVAGAHTNAGTYPITCSGADAGGNYTISYQPGTLTVTKATVAVTADSQSKVYGSADPTFSYAVSGLVGGDTLTTQPTCSVAGGHANVGTYPITCSGADAGGNYTIAYQPGTLTVTKATVTVTADDQSKTYGEADPTFSFHTTGLVGGDSFSTPPTCDVTGAHQNVGHYDITCSGANAGGNYTIAYEPGTLTVIAAAVTITADNQTKQYGAADPAFSATVTGLVGTDTLTTPPTCDVAGDHTDVGSYAIDCSGAQAAPNYSISYQPGTLTVTKATVTVSADNASKVYGEADPVFSYGVAGLVGTDTLTTPPTCGVTGAHSNAGSYVISCSGASAGSNYDVAYQPGTLTVTKATATVTADNQTKVFGTADPPFTFAVAGLVGTDVLTTQPTCDVTGAHSSVGTYPITCSGAAAGNNYTIAYQSGTLTVTKATVTITADNQSKVYGTADPTFTFHVAGLVGGDTLTTQPTCHVAGAHSDVGTYPITCSGAEAAGDYAVVYQAGTLTVTKATATITADSTSKVYGSADPAFGFHTAGLVGGDTLTTAPTCDVAGAHSDVGTYPITCSGADAGRNYSIVYQPGTLTVTKAAVTITADSKSKVYGAADPTFTYTVGGLVGADALTTQPTCDVSGAHHDVGTYPITCSGAVASDNYDVAYQPGTLTVTKATVTVAADNKSKVYGEADPTFASHVSGLVGGDSLTTPPTCDVAGAHSGAGTYPIACSGADAGGNYTIVYQPGALTVAKATVTITADNQTKVYGTPDPTYTFNVSGLVGGDNLATPPTCTVSGVHANVGSYSITCSGADAGGNYTVAYQPGTLTVTKAAITIAADNKSRAYGAADPAFTFTTTGLVGSDTLTTQPTCTVAGAHSLVGSYPIICSGANAGGNYTISYQPGTLNVTKATPTVTTVPSPGVPSGGTVSDSATLDVGTGSTSGVVTFRLYGPNDPDCTQLYGTATGTISANHAVSGSIAVLPPGVYRWTANYAGDSNTNAVTTACAEPVTIGAQVLTGRAYGLAASFNLLGLPLTLVAPTPDTGPVATTASTTVTKSCVNLTGLVSATALCPSVTTTASPSAKSVAKVSVASVDIGILGLPVITVKALETTSTTTCAGSTGATTIEYLAVGGQVVISAKTTVKPNTKIQIGGVTIVLNEQVPFSTPDQGLTVNGLRISAVGLGTALNAVVAPSESDIGNCP
jgi:hypothetical protein